MKYLSVCSGIESATSAWHPLGWVPFGFSEIEPFPAAVLSYHYPEIQNFGDMTKFKEWNIERGSIDVLVGGTPCQSYSIAGLRKGLADPRGNLMLTYGSIADHLRPRWIVWENVPGVLSSYSGEEPPSDLQEGEEWESTETSDFGGFLSMLAELGYGFAYRILDAQYVRVESHRRAVPQRRRRVFVVGYLGDWRRAASVLFESESMCRYTPPSRKAGERVAGTIASRTGAGGGLGTDFDLAGGLQPYEVGNCLTQRMHKGINSTLDEGQTPVISGYHMTGRGYWQEGGGTLRAREQDSHENVVAFAQNSRDEVREMEVPGAIAADHGAKQQNYVRQGYSVRRLTPEECERLQGFPTGWTRIPWKNKPEENCPDGPRYKAIGNSMAVNVMSWIGQRIQKEETSLHK